MGYYKEKTVLNTEGAIFDIEGLKRNEAVGVSFDVDDSGTEEVFTGVFSFKIYNSIKKNQTLSSQTDLNLENSSSITVVIDTPSFATDKSSIFYYELYNVDEKRVYVSGKIKIID